MQYFGGAASYMDYQHEFIQAGISWEVLATLVALGRWAGQNGVWQVIWCLGRLSPLQKTFPQVLQVYDDGNCTKLSPIKRFFFKKYISRVWMMLGLCASWQCGCLTSSWRKEPCSRSCRGRIQVVRGPRESWPSCPPQPPGCHANILLTPPHLLHILLLPIIQFLLLILLLLFLIFLLLLLLLFLLLLEIWKASRLSLLACRDM